MQELRWGIVGCGMISHDFVKSFKNCNYSHKVVALGDDNLENAQKFKEKLVLDEYVQVYGNYDDFFQDKNIDIVYIGIVNFLHYQLVMKALDHNKHVLCEKPLGVNVKQVKEMIEKARDKKLFLMEALISVFCPAWQQIQKQINEKVLGEMRTVHANMAVPGYGSNRNRFRQNQGFTLLDLAATPILDFGLYALLFGLWMFDGEKPQKVLVDGEINDQGIDTWANITLIFSNNRKAILFYSTEDCTPFSAFVGCENGTYTIDENFRVASKFTRIEGNFRVVNPKKIEFGEPIKEKAEEFFFNGSSTLKYETDHVFECLRDGKFESDVATHEFSLTLAEVVQEVRRKLGVVLSFDK